MTFRDRFFPLKPLKSSEKPIRIMAFDTEDNGTGVGTNFICGCVYEGPDPKDQHVFWSRRTMRNHIFSQHRYSTVAVAHNLRYDLDNIDYPEKTAERLTVKTRLIGAVYHYGKKMQMRMLDTGNFFVGASIDSLGKQLSIDNPGRFDKLGCKCFDPSHPGKNWSNFNDEGICRECQMFCVHYLKNKNPYSIPQKVRSHIEEYCMRDAEICYITIKKIMQMTMEHKTRFKSFTAPSLACRIFRTKHMPGSWHKRHILINDMERLAYYGGRTEVFDYRYFEHINAEDIRSSYPKAMHDGIFPFPSNFEIRNLPIGTALEDEGISLVRVRVPHMNIPPLPYRHSDGKLIFPTGEWTAAYTHPEIRMALRHGVEILACHESMIYPDTFEPFKGYVSEFYHKKDTTSGIEREFYKLLLNGLSGKWGEKRISSITLKADDPKLADLLCQCDKHHPDTYEPEPIPGTNMCNACDKPIIEFSHIETDNGYTSVIGCRQPDPKNAFPILIAYITAYGRIKLFEDRLMNGNKGDTIVYADTDSTMSDHIYNLNTGPALGDWECQTYEGFIAFAPKYYDFGYKEYEKDGKLMRTKGNLKLKGIPKRHEIVYDCPFCLNGWETPEEVFLTNGGFCCNCYAKLSEDDKRYKFERPLKTSEAERRHMNPNTWIIVKKHISKIDSKRTKNNDGTSTPLHINGSDYQSFTDLLKKKPQEPIA